MTVCLVLIMIYSSIGANACFLSGYRIELVHAETATKATSRLLLKEGIDELS
jgi:hypothetical protein